MVISIYCHSVRSPRIVVLPKGIGYFQLDDQTDGSVELFSAVRNEVFCHEMNVTLVLRLPSRELALVINFGDLKLEDVLIFMKVIF